MLKRLRPLLLVLVWVMIIAVMLEVGLRLAAPMLPANLASTARYVMTGQFYPEEWTPAWQQNIENYYALRPGLDNALQYGSPTVSFHLSTIELWEGGGIGFRTRPVDYFVDAVVVGDSFGLCFTEIDDCWVNILERDSGMGMVNLSQPVTGTTSHLRILKAFGEPLKPPLVIWQFFGNDFNDDYGLAVFREEIEEIPEESVAETPTFIGWLRRNSVAFAVTETALKGQWLGVPETERLFVKPYQVMIGDTPMQFGAIYEQQSLDMTREQNQIGLQYSREAFREAKSLVESWGRQLVVVLIPTREKVYEHLTLGQLGEDGMRTLESASEAMLDLCAELDLTCFDPLPQFQERALQNEALYFTDDLHLNPHGNAVLAEILQFWLDEQGLLPTSH